jgi:hypothetical protein
VSILTLTDERIKELCSDRVNYYWEVPVSYPTIEVFLEGTEDEIIGIKNHLESLVRDKRISEEAIDFDYESFNENYHRILGAFDVYYMSEENLLSVIELMEKIGHWEYNSDKDNGWGFIK